MPKKGDREEQIIAALKQYEGGEKTADICRKLGISQATFYMWKKQYAGLGVQELRELRQLREENKLIELEDGSHIFGSSRLNRRTPTGISTGNGRSRFQLTFS